MLQHLKSRERYIQVTVTGLIYYIVDPPCYEYLKESHKRDAGDGLWVDIGEGNNPSTQTQLPQPLPHGAFYNWIYVHNWNSFIHIAAMDSSIEVN